MIADTVQDQVDRLITEHGLTVVEADLERPWGGFFHLADDQAPQFLKAFFPDIQVTGHVSPKFLVIAPQRRVSWQYHRRRAEHWHVIQGPVGMEQSTADEEPEAEVIATGKQVGVAPLERHRLVGLDDWAIVAEVWEHTDPDHPSDEADIVRVQDDFERETV